MQYKDVEKRLFYFRVVNCSIRGLLDTAAVVWYTKKFRQEPNEKTIHER
jgi:hypothetical protein